uniref:Uncharacterized protein n=1 Tax=Anguilla anguilla TaxID=7936 RepID=A0A0E9T9A0_ANGAN
MSSDCGRPQSNCTNFHC